MPESLEISIDDAQARALYARLPDDLARAVRATLQDASTLLLRDLSTYPPPPPNSTYVRTRTLGRSWSRTPVQGSGLDLRVSIGSNSNMAPYNRVVMDADRQARIHRGRWQTVQSVRAAREQVVLDMFAARVEAELRLR